MKFSEGLEIDWKKLTDMITTTRFLSIFCTTTFGLWILRLVQSVGILQFADDSRHDQFSMDRKSATRPATARCVTNRSKYLG